jgi:hypothetical protein
MGANGLYTVPLTKTSDNDSVPAGAKLTDAVQRATRRATACERSSSAASKERRNSRSTQTLTIRGASGV